MQCPARIRTRERERRAQHVQQQGTGGAPLVAQMVKNLPAMQETQVQFLGQEDPLEKGTAAGDWLHAL